VKKFMKTTAVWLALIAVILCTCKDDSDSGNNQPDYKMTDTYTFVNTGGICTWTFIAGGKYRCAGYGFTGIKTGTWSSSGNDVTISYEAGSTVSGKEVFTVQDKGNQLTLTLKDKNALTSLVLNTFMLNDKSVTLTKSINNGNNGGGDTSIKKIEMVSIPAGTFIMGSPESEPNRVGGFWDLGAETQHSVTLSGFSMSKYQVTQAQWIAVMGASEDQTIDFLGKGNNYPIYYVNWYDAIVFCNKLSIKEGLNPVYSIGGKTDPTDWGTIPHLGNNASWDAVVMDTSKNGYRLPTEAEWEYACRGDYPNKATETNTKPFGIGDGTKMISGMANFDGWYPYDLDKSGNYDEIGTYLGKATPVGIYAANNYGLYDMHGNVYEWCWDRGNGRYSTESQTDPVGPDNDDSARVIRGGGFNSEGKYLRSAERGWTGSDGGGPDVGFRLVRSN
jgi:formylglycine-generating enzyme